MTRKEAKELLPIIQAFAEGKTIQIKKEGDWLEVGENTKVYFSESPSDYRIKPEPKYRPFRTQEECWDEMHKHPDFGYVRGKSIQKYNNIVMVSTNTDELLVTICGELGAHLLSANHMFECYTFTDGTPFGIKVE